MNIQELRIEIDKIDNKDDFNNTLFAAGYSTEHEDMWDSFRFSLIEGKKNFHNRKIINN